MSDESRLQETEGAKSAHTNNQSALEHERFSNLPHLDRRYKLVYKPSIAPQSSSKIEYRSEQRQADLLPTESSPVSPQAEIGSNAAPVTPNLRGNDSTPNPQYSPNQWEADKIGWGIFVLVAIWLFLQFGMGKVNPETGERTQSRRNAPSDGSRRAGDSQYTSDIEPNWSLVLGVSMQASVAEIKRAYRERMSEYHPDKVASLGAEIRALAERKTKEINSAYQDAMRAKGIDE